MALKKTQGGIQGTLGAVSHYRRKKDRKHRCYAVGFSRGGSTAVNSCAKR
jgi:hypothetical protein